MAGRNSAGMTFSLILKKLCFILYLELYQRINIYSPLSLSAKKAAERNACEIEK
jgi:hypothetical protein